jgi:glycyl-tRNA synthetase beta chain
LVDRAITLAKKDLLTEMVYEFPELQGIMGAYYAEKLGEPLEVVTAIREQYLPSGESDSLPSTDISAIVALSNRLDSLFALFSIGEKPTGSKDPLGLRRAVNGIIRISLDRRINLSIDEVFEKCDMYAEFDISRLKEFFYERIYSFYKDTNPTIVKAVIATTSSILDIDMKLSALKIIVSKAEFKEYVALFKRIANILKKASTSSEGVDTELFQSEHERRLYEKYTAIVEQNSKESSYLKQIENLLQLKDYLSDYFDNVMVNADDSRIRENRLSMMRLIYTEFLKIADIKEISI